MKSLINSQKLLTLVDNVELLRVDGHELMEMNPKADKTVLHVESFFTYS